MLENIFFKAYDILDEQAENLTTIKNDLKNKNSNEYRIKHLIKLFLFRDNLEDFNGWCAEVKNSLYKTDKWTKNNKYLNKEQILKFIWNYWQDSFYDWLPNIIIDVQVEGNYNKIPNYNPTNMYNFFKDYYMWLAENLSKNGRINVLQVRDIIKELREKYSIN